MSFLITKTYIKNNIGSYAFVYTKNNNIFDINYYAGKLEDFIDNNLIFEEEIIIKYEDIKKISFENIH